MTESFNVLVIGAGLAGLSTSFELARRGLKTAIIYDPKDFIYATKATHGISTIKGILESDAELFGLKLEGHRGFSDWLSEVESVAGVNRPQNAWKVGVEESFQTFEYFQKEFGRIYRKDFIGAKRVSWLRSNPDEFARVNYPGDWWIDPEYLIETLWKALRRLAVQEVLGGVDSVKAEEKRVIVQTSCERSFEAQRAILCAGVGTSGILARSSLPLREKMFAVAGHTFAATSDCARNYCVVKGTSGATQIGRKIFWGSTSESALVVEKDTARTCLALRQTQDEKSIAMNHLQQLFPVSTNARFEDLNVRWGVRVRTRHRAPLVEALPEPSLSSIWVNCGYYKSGIILSWLMAKKLAFVIGAEHPYSSNR